MAAGAVAGGGIGMVGSLMEASDKASAYNQQADELERNAGLDLATGKYNEMRQQIIAGHKFGGITADYAASGIGSDSGSAMAVMAASHVNSEFDRLNILHGAQVKATMARDRATVDRSAADRSIQEGYFNAFGSLFGAGTKAAAMTPDSKGGEDAED